MRMCRCCVGKNHGIESCMPCKVSQRVFAWKNYKLWRNILFVYVTTFLILLPMVCSNMQNTLLDKMYFRNETIENERLIRNNAVRYNQSVDILNTARDKGNSAQLRKLLAGFGESAELVKGIKEDSFPANNEFARNTVQKIDIVITIITVSRNSEKGTKYNPNYLTQTLAAFVMLFNTDTFVFDKFSLGLRVCNVDPNPDTYADMVLVPKWIPIYQRFSTSELSTESLSYNARLNKEKDDYVYCLNKSLQENTSFVLLVEDDAVPRKELFSVLGTKLFRVRNNITGEYPMMNNVTFVKLYHPERLLGYIGIEIDRLTELFSLGVILTMLVMCSYFKCNVIKSDQSKRLWFVVFLFFCAVLLTIGRPNMLELRRVSNFLYQVTPAPSCCTPAMLFPRQGAQLVANYLQMVQCKAKFGKDSALDQLITKNSLVTKLISPNLFEHIGHFSSLRYELLNPFIV